MKNQMSIKYLREVDPDALIHMNGTMVELRDQILLDHKMDRNLLRRVLSFAFLNRLALGARVEEQDYFTFPEIVQSFDHMYWGFDDRHFQDPMKLLELHVRSLAYYGEAEGAEKLQYAFPEFEPYIGQCKFTGCAHVKEKGCAVLAAVEAGEIAKTRHESYVKLYESVKDLKEWELTKGGTR